MPKSGHPRPKPRGREEAMSELLNAARTLFADRGFDAVSVRDISELANVNHALLHRHFGTKENLLREVMRVEATTFAGIVGEIEDPATALRRLFAANVADPAFARILASALLSSLELREFLAVDGTLVRIADVLASKAKSAAGSDRRAKEIEAVARENTAMIAAMSLGWLLFEPFLASALHIEESRLTTTRTRVEDLIELLLPQSLDGVGREANRAGRRTTSSTERRRKTDSA